MGETVPRPSRRAFLVATAGAMVAAACGDDSDPTGGDGAGPTPRPTQAPAPTSPLPTPAPPTPTPLPVPELAGPPFTLGVASGDPLPDAVVLWTRLAPDPTAVDGAMSADDVPVSWELAADEAFTEVVVTGVAVATVEFAHSVHVDVGGLQPATSYWYRFTVGGHQSPVGRTRTAPRVTDAEPVRFAVATCQAYQSGFYAAYRDMSEHELDAVLFTGDYIYELEPSTQARRHGMGPAHTVEDFRRYYAVNKTDPDLQAAHAAHPWIVTWDDHEVEDNYGGLSPGGIGRSLGREGDADAEFPDKRAAAYRAWWEHMPVRVPPPGDDATLRIYRSFEFGSLVTAAVLDNRQYRDPIPESAGAGALPRMLGGGPQIPEAFDENRTILGFEQEAWLEDVLRSSEATWKLIVQQTLVAELDRRPDLDDAGYSSDSWDGYVAARNRLLGMIEREGISNVVSLGGDIHTAAVADLKPDYKDPASPVIGAELVTPSISALEFISDEALAGSRSNPHIHEYEPFRRGWLLVTATVADLTAEFRYVLDALEPGSPTEPGSTWVVTAGDPRIRPA